MMQGKWGLRINRHLRPICAVHRLKKKKSKKKKVKKKKKKKKKKNGGGGGGWRGGGEIVRKITWRYW